jgi:hypothetical protein
VWIAYQYPYSNDHLEVFLERALVSPFCAAETCGTSTEGRPIRLITVTDPEAIDSKKTVWLTGIQHPAETGAGWGIEGAIDYLLSADPGAAQARRGCVFKMVPLVNVDAVAEGRGRLHPQNRNLNREWEKGDPAPEVAGVRAAMERWVAQGNSIDAFIDIHGFSGVTDRNWVLLPLAEGSYPAPLAADLERFEQTLCSRIPFRVAPHPQAGFAAGMAARRFGAQAFSVDGYVFRWPVAGVPPDLAAHYLQGCQVWPLSDLKAAGGELVKAVTEHLLGDDALLRP